MTFAGPRVIIAGAPKCGTTSLFRWLSDHPQVCAASIKEVRWFMDNGYPLQREDGGVQRHGLAPYAQFFAHCPGDGQMTVEATPDYLYQRTALEWVPRMSAVRRVLFVLRRPADRVLSMYRFAGNNMARLEPNLSFRAFVERCLNDPDSFGDRQLIAGSILHSNYAQWLAPWYAALGHERVQVVLLEDIQRDPVRTLKALSLDLDLSPEFWDDYAFPSENESFAVRYFWVQRLVRYLQRFVPRNRLTRRLNDTYRRLNSRKKPAPDASEIPGVLRELDAYFAPGYADLEALTGRSVAIWQR